MLRLLIGALSLVSVIGLFEALDELVILGGAFLRGEDARGGFHVEEVLCSLDGLEPVGNHDGGEVAAVLHLLLLYLA